MDQAPHVEHHHDHVHTPAMDKKFIDASVNSKTMIFDGLRATDNVELSFDNHFAHLNDLPMLQ
jgi:hypothetical protein